MTDTLIKNIEVHSSFGRNMPGNVYLLPKWEKVKTVSCSKSSFFFTKKHYNEHLFKKYSLKNRLEKFEVRNDAGSVDAGMDLKVYKDNVYIINLDVSHRNFNSALIILLQAAAEKAMYNTTDKKVLINLSLPFSLKLKIKKILKHCGYVASVQSKYEKELLGEEFVLDLKNTSNLDSLIKSSDYYIDK